MSAPETQREEQSRSRVKFTLNAKGDTQIEVSVRAGDTATEVENARLLAQDAYAESISWLVSKGLRAA